MQTVVATRVAFKEWAVAVRALAAGQQIVLIRKGGIHEEGREFRVEQPEFLLYPTYEHQRADLLQPAHQPALAATLEQVPDANTVRLEYWARVTDIYETLDEDEVTRLSAHYVWTASYAEERLRWRPKKPLYVLLLRVYRLLTAHTVPVQPTYLGCKSWVELAQPISLDGMTPVLDDAAYASECAAVRAALGR